ncbi:MAG: ABC transporter permease, partial [candidate division NC10 bacterium]
MQRYIIKRFLLMIPTLLGVAVFIFLLMRVIPGDVVELRLTSEGGFVTEEVLATERARLGLDKPLWQQFVNWIWGIVRLDFGTSMWTGRPISHEIGIRLELSLEV